MSIPVFFLLEIKKKGSGLNDLYKKNNHLPCGFFCIHDWANINRRDFDFIDNENINLFFGENSHLVTYPLNKMGKKNSIFIFKDHNKVGKFYYKWRYSKEGISFLTERLNKKL